MKKFLYVLTIIFLVLGLAFTILPLGTIAFLPIGLALFFATIAFFVKKSSYLTDLIVTALGDKMKCKITEVKSDAIFFSYNKSGNVISLPISRVASYTYDFNKNKSATRKPAKILLIIGAALALTVIFKVLVFESKVAEKTEEELQKTEQRELESLEALEALEGAMIELEELEGLE